MWLRAEVTWRGEDFRERCRTALVGVEVAMAAILLESWGSIVVGLIDIGVCCSSEVVLRARYKYVAKMWYRSCYRTAAEAVYDFFADLKIAS